MTRATAAPDLESRLTRWLVVALLGALGWTVLPLVKESISPERWRQEGETRERLVTITQKLADLQLTVTAMQTRMDRLEASEKHSAASTPRGRK